MDLTFVPQMLVLKLGENQDHPTLCCRFIMETSVLSGVSSSVERAVNCLWLFNSYMEATRLPCNCTELLLIYISSVDHHRDCSGLSVKMTSKPWVDHRLFCLTTEDKRGNSENVCRLRAAWLALPPTERSTWRNGTELSLCFVLFFLTGSLSSLASTCSCLWTQSFFQGREVNVVGFLSPSGSTALFTPLGTGERIWAN